MKTITSNTILNVTPNFEVSIGNTETEVAIISKNTGTFVKLSQAKKSKKLSEIKRKFKWQLNNDQDFCFSWMFEKQALELIKILRG
jgi:hypothetical protein